MVVRAGRVEPSDGVAWITGASSGIGRALALRLARDGWTVAASARRTALLEALAAEAGGLAGRIVPIPCDLTACGAPAEAVARIEATAGPLALAVLSAGMQQADRMPGLDLPGLRAVFELNVIAAMGCAEAAAARMTDRQRGQIAFIASLAGYRGLPGAIGYGGSKAALRNMVEALAFDLHPRGIRVQSICPGFVRTPLTDGAGFPMPFLMEAERAADVIVRGLRSPRFEIAFPWPLVLMAKLARLLPPRLYHALIASLGARAGR